MSIVVFMYVFHKVAFENEQMDKIVIRLVAGECI